MIEPATLQEAPTAPSVEQVKVKAPPFNKQSARMYALKSWESRRAKKAAAEEAAKSPPPAPQAHSSAPWSEELELVQEQIAHTREVLNDRTPACKYCERGPLEPQHRAQLLKALDALLDRKRILQERPLPGSRRPAAESSRSRPGLFTAPQPEPTTPQGNAGQEQE